MAKSTPKWFYLVLIAIPVLFLVLFEWGLRIFDYGNDFDQWIEITPEKLVLNPDVSGRYFYNTPSLPQSINDSFDKVKRDNAFRVFVLGGSSAFGFPFAPNGAFSRYVRDRLELDFPDKKIEVVNIAITAVNSYTLRDLIDGVLEKKPDLILIYAGHNEYYGALGVGSMESLGTSRTIVNLVLELNKFKTVQLIRDFIAWSFSLLGTEKQPDTGTLMAKMAEEQEIIYQSDVYKAGIEQFKENMKDILSKSRDADVPLLIGTLTSNLKDQPPFISAPGNNYPPASEIYKKGKKYLDDAEYRKADSLFRFAKDLDALRFRAPEKINQVIEEFTKKENCFLVEVDSSFNSVSPQNIVGNNLMVDHLHPTLRGYQLLGKIYYSAMKQNQLLPGQTKLLPEEKADSIVIAEFDFSELDSLTAEYRITGLLNDFPFVMEAAPDPFKNIKLHDKIDSIAFATFRGRMKWEQAHLEAADYYFSKREYNKFSKEMKIAISQYPFKLSYYDRAAYKLMQAKKYELAFSFLKRRYEIKPDRYSSKWIGNIYLNNGEPKKAIKYLNKSLSFKKDPQVYYNLGAAYYRLREIGKAIRMLQYCLDADPNYPNATNLLNQLKQLQN